MHIIIFLISLLLSSSQMLLGAPRGDAPSITPVFTNPLDTLLFIQNTQIPVIGGTLNSVARFADSTLKNLKNSPVFIDDNGNVQLNGIIKDGNIISWPSTCGTFGQVLTSDGNCGLIFTNGGGGGGNVSTASTFTVDNRLIRTDTPSGPTNVQQSGVTLDDSNNMSGLNSVTATTFNGNLNGNATTATNATHATTATTATNFTGSLSGDVTGTQSATVVNFVGGQSAANVASATVAANAATNANTPNTIVKRDGSGNFSAGVITANLNGNATTATTATNFTGSLSGDVTGTQSATVVSFVGGQSAANVASATVAANAATSANTPNTIVKRDGSGNFSANTITATLNGTATSTGSFTGSLSGDVTGTQSATVVSFVGGQTAANVASATAAANAATSANTPNTIVKRNGSGNFSAGTVTAALVGNVTGNATTATTATTATNFTGPLSGDVTGTQSATVVSFVGGQSAANVAAATVAANAATSANTPNTIVKRDGSGNFSANTITATLTGHASLDVLKAGDTMTGTLSMANGNAVDFRESSGTNFVGIQGPSSVTSSYTLALPSVAPTAGQFLHAGPTTPTNLAWLTSGGSVPPATSEIIYVTTYGNDVTGNGSFDQPYASLAQAVSTANSIASSLNPVTIFVAPGFYFENNIAGPITITTDGITIFGTSQTGTFIVPQNTANTLLLVNNTITVTDVNFLALGLSTATGVACTASTLSIFRNVSFTNFSTGISCSGTGATYIFETCLFSTNGTALANNDAIVNCINCGLVGASSLSGPPANTGITATGAQAILNINGGNYTLCQTCISISNSSSCFINAAFLQGNSFDIIQTSGAQSNLETVAFVTTHNAGDSKIQVSGAGSFTTITGCSFNGLDQLGSPQGTAITVTNNGQAYVNGGSINNYITGLVIGTNSDTSSTQLIASSLAIQNCTNDIIQNGTSTLNFNASVAAGNKIMLNDSTNVSIALFDTNDGNILSIGSGSIVDTPLLQIFNGTEGSQLVRYQNNLYGTQAIGFENNLANPTSWYTACASATDFVAITTDRTQNSSLKLFSDTGSPYGGTSALRGWTVSKNGAAAPLAFAYQNSDTNGQGAIPQYTLLQLDGVNNQVQLPNAATELVFDGDTNLYRNSANVLKTDSNFIVTPLTAGRAVITDPITDQLASSVTTSAEVAFLSGVTSSVQTQLNNKVNKSGDTMTGALQLPAGSAAAPSLNFTGSTTTGLSASAGNLSFSTNGTEQLKISSGGTVSVNGFSSAGIVHNDASGNLSSSLIVNADVSASAGIVDTKLATITTAGKVANSATTATNANTANTIVLRDSNGNFNAGTITAALTGNVTGSASNNVLKVGDTMTGTLVLPAGSAASPSLKFSGSTNTGISAASVNTLSFDTNGAEAMKIGPTGTITIDGFSGTAGVVHNDSSGNLSSSLIVNNDITNATITNAKLATISSSDTSGAIVVRDGSGNFATNMITIDGTTTNPTDVATKAYVDSIAATGLQAKTPAVVVSTSNVVLSGLQTIDGVTLVDSDRVLLVGQTIATQNGLWVAHAIAWTRPTDFATGTTAGEAYVLITSGTVNAGSSWLCNTPTALIDIDPIGFAEFSLPNQTTGANVGPGAGQVFQGKTGITLNFRTIAAGTHMVVTNNSDNIALSTDATSANTASTIVARDASGNFSADTITATLVGSASLNVLKAGDTMTGALNMASQNPINFYDAGNVNFVGIEAPSSVASSYTLQWPSAAPTASQTLRAGSTTPTDLAWVTEGGSIQPATSSTIYVTTYGNDVTGDGSFDKPYASLAKAITVANSLSSLLTPVTITMGPGTYTENNSAGPLAITSAGISVVGASPIGTVVQPSTLNQNLLSIGDTAQLSDIEFNVPTPSVSAATALVFTNGLFSNIKNVRVINFLTGVSCSNSASAYAFDNCFFNLNGTALSVNDTYMQLNNCNVLGTNILTGPPANTGVTATGASTVFNVSGGTYSLCQTAMNFTSNARAYVDGALFEFNAQDILQASASAATITGCSFAVTNSNSDIDITLSGSGTSAQIIGCNFDGRNLAGTTQATGIQVTGNATALINSSSLSHYTTALQVGASLDTASTAVTAASSSIQNCTNDIVQNGTATLNFNASVASDEKITINNSLNVNIALFDTTANNILTIGSGSIVDTPLLQIYNGVDESQTLRYKNSLYGTQALGFENDLVNPTSLFAVSTSATDFVAITTDRTQNSGLMLFSDTGGSYGTTSALRGWTVSKNGAAAPLTFAYQNSDLAGQSAVPQYTVFQLDGVNNQVQLPNAATQLVFDSDTNLYRNSANVLKTDDNFIVGPLTAGRAVITDPITDQLASSITTSAEVAFLSGVTSSVQTQLNNKVNKSGDTMTGALQLPAGTNANPSLTFTGSTTTGLSASTGNLSLNTNGIERLAISSGGTISVDGFAVAGVVHNDASGNLSSSLIVNADVSASAGIVDTKLATITTAGKVANSATTATNANTANTIVLRDSNGNFSAGTITGTLTGHASLDVLKAGDTMTGTLQMPAGSAAAPSIQFTGSTNTGISAATANTLSFDTNGAEAMKIGPTGTITIDGFSTAGVVKNDASGNLSSIAGTNGQVLLGATGASPAFATLTSTGNTLTYTPGANSLNIDLTAPVTVANGGTGATSLTSHSLLLGNGTSAISALGAATDGQIPIGSTGANPVLSTITAGSNVTVTNGAGSITVGVTGGSFVPTGGGTMTGTLQLPAGSAASPSLQFTGSTNTGLSAATANTLSFDTNGAEAMKIGPTGTITIDAFNTAGVVHNDSSGNLSSSLIVNADVSASAGIVDTKLATISTAGKVANSATTATSANTPNTIVLRDGSGNFSAGTVTAALVGNVTGHASLDVLKAGDTMTGALTMATGNAIDFQAASGGNFVGIQGPSSVTSSYTLALPTTSPTAGQLLVASASTPTQLTWTSGGPSSTTTIYVAPNGNDTTGTGTFNNPYLTLSKAITVANGTSTATAPVTIYLADGTYSENNSSGPLTITADGISIIGASRLGTVVSPSTITQTLLSTDNTVNISNLTFKVSGNSSAIAVSCTSGYFTTFSKVEFLNFQTGLYCEGSNSTYVLDTCIFNNNGTGLSISNATVDACNCNFVGSCSTNSTPINTGITMTGSSALLNLNSSSCTLCGNALTVASSAQAFVNGVTFQLNIYDIFVNTGAQLTVADSDFITTFSSSDIKVNVMNSNSVAQIIGCTFNGLSSSSTVQGSAVKVTNGGQVIMNSDSIQNYTTALTDGVSTDTSSTILRGTGLYLKGNTTDISQNGTSTLDINGSIASSTKLTISSTTNVAISYFDLINNLFVTKGVLLPASTKAIYVAPNGNDTTGDGAPTNPFATLSQAITTANGISTATTPVTIFLAEGTYTENNSAGPLTITTDGISIVGASKIGTIISPSTITQNLLSTDITMRIENVHFKVSGNSTAIAVSCTAGFYTTFSNVIFTNFQTGLYCEGSNSTYVLDTCIFNNNGTGLSISNTTVDACNCNITGSCSTNSTPINTGITMTGSSAILNLDSSNCTLCGNALTVASSAQAFVNATNFTLNIFDIVVNTSGILTIGDSNFNTTFSSSDIKINVNGGTATINSCAFNGLSTSSTVQGSALKVINAGQLIVSGGTIINYTTAITDGQSTDTSTTSATVAGTYLSGNTTDITQNGTSTLKLDAAVASSSKLTINSSTNVFPAYFDAASNNALILPAGSAASPSLKFNGSTNTGISAATANTLSFDTNGTEQMNIGTSAINAILPLVVQNLLITSAIQVASFSGSGSVTINQNTSILLIKNNAGAGITVTMTFPSNPTNGQLCTLIANSITSTITLSYVAGTGGASFANTMSFFGGSYMNTGGGVAVSFIYVSADNTWYRIFRG